MTQSTPQQSQQPTQAAAPLATHGTATRDADFWRQVNDYIAFMKGSLPQSLLAVMSDEVMLSEAKEAVKEARQPVVVGPSSASQGPAHPQQSSGGSHQSFDYRTYLPAAVASKLRDLCTPYTKIGDAVPEQRDNDDFWIAAESAVRSIHKDIRLDDFPPEAVGVIGPELCGPVAWPQLIVPRGGWNADDDGNQVVTGRSIAWRRFKEVFEKRFGLTLTQKLERFYALEMKSGEDAIAFVCKVDATMRKLNAQLPAPDKLSPSAVLHAFKDKLPLHLRSRLEAHRQLKAARAESAPAWDDLVNIVRDDRNGGSMLSAAERAAISGATTRKVTPAVSVASLTSVSEVGAVNSALLPAAGTIAAVQPGTNRPVCPLCTRLGADFTNHTLETCYCNPASKEYRPDIRYRRIMQARRRGITVPQDILDMAPFTPGEPPAPVAKVQSLLQPDIEASYRVALANAGVSGPAVDYIVDSTLAQFLAVADSHHPVPAGVQGMVQTRSDGVYGATQVFATASATLPQPEVADAAVVQGVINALHSGQTYAPAVNDVSTSALIKYLVQRLVPAELIGAARTRSPLDMNTIVTRMSSSLPLFARCELDRGLRMMVLMRLLKQCADDGTAVPIMQGSMVQYMPRATFDALDSQLAGITEHNLAEVEARLRQLGVAYALPRVPYGSPAPPPPPTPTPVQPAQLPPPAPAPMQIPMPGQAPGQVQTMEQQVAAAVVAQLQSLAASAGATAGNVVPTATSGSAVNAAFKGTTVAGHPPAGYAVPHLTMTTPPNWAAGKPDKRAVLPWDSEQVISEVMVNGVLMRGCIDTGACRTLMSVSFAQACGLPITKAENGNCGTYQVPGQPGLQNYAGVVPEVQFTFGPDVTFTIKGLRVIEHPQPMFLIGSDILRGGRSASEWNFSGLITETHAAGNVSGCLVFVRSGSEVRCPCVNVPTEGVQPFAYNPQAASIPVAAAAFVRSGMIGMVSRPLPQFNLVAGPPLKVPDRIFRVSG